MDKEALLNNILNDLEEIQTMVKTFQGQQNIPAAFLELTQNKLNHVSDEFLVLKNLENKANPAEIKTKTTRQEPEIIEEKEVPVQKIEPEKVVHKETTLEAPSTTEEETNSAPKEQVPEPIATAESQQKKEVETSSVKEEEENKRTIGESLVGDKKSVNEIIANNQEANAKKVLKGKPISDLTKGLGINDRFMFQRELFEGKAEVMTQTLQQLNSMPDLNAAQSFIKSNFNWNEEQEVTQAFFNYIERKF